MSEANLRRSTSAHSAGDLRRSNSAASHRNLLPEPGEARNSGVVLSGSSLTFYKRTIDSNPDWPGSKNYFQSISAQPAYKSYSVEEIRYIDYSRAGSQRTKYVRARDLAANPPMAFHSISAMGEYLDCCVEEIRFEDYSYFPKNMGRDNHARFYGFADEGKEVPIENIFQSPARSNTDDETQVEGDASASADELGFRAPPPAPQLLPSLVEPEPASPPKDRSSPPTAVASRSLDVAANEENTLKLQLSAEKANGEYNDDEEPTSLLLQLQEMMRQAQQIRKGHNDNKMKHLRETAEMFNRALGMADASKDDAPSASKDAEENANGNTRGAESDSDSDEDDKKSLHHQTQFPSVLALPDSPSSGTVEDNININNADGFDDIKALPLAISRQNSTSESNSSIPEPESSNTFKSELESGTYTSESESATKSNDSSSVHSEEDVDDVPVAEEEVVAIRSIPAATPFDDANSAAKESLPSPVKVKPNDPFATTAAPQGALVAPKAAGDGMDTTNEEDDREEDRVEHMKRMDSFLEDAAAVALVTPIEKSSRTTLLAKSAPTSTGNATRSDGSSTHAKSAPRQGSTRSGRSGKSAQSARSGVSARSKGAIITDESNAPRDTIGTIGDRPRAREEINVSAKFNLGSSEKPIKVKRGVVRSGSRGGMPGILKSASNGNMKRVASNQSVESLSRSQSVYQSVYHHKKDSSSTATDQLPLKKAKRSREEASSASASLDVAAAGPVFTKAFSPAVSPAPAAPPLPVEELVNPFSPSVSSPPSTYSNPFTTSSVSEQQPANASTSRSLHTLPVANAANTSNTTAAPGAAFTNSTIFRSSPVSNVVADAPALPEAPSDLFKPLGLKQAPREFSTLATTPRAKSFTPQSSSELLALQMKHMNSSAGPKPRPASLNWRHKEDISKCNSHVFKSAFQLFEERTRNDAPRVPSSAPPNASPGWITEGKFRFKSHEQNEAASRNATGRSISHDAFPTNRTQFKPATPKTEVSVNATATPAVAEETRKYPNSAARSFEMFPTAGVENKPSKSHESMPEQKAEAPVAPVVAAAKAEDTDKNIFESWRKEVDDPSVSTDSLFSPLVFSSPLATKEQILVLSPSKKKLQKENSPARSAQQLDKQKLALPFGAPGAKPAQKSPGVAPTVAENEAEAGATDDSYSPSPIVKSSDLKNALRSLVKPSPVVSEPKLGSTVPTPPPPPPPMNARTTADEIDSDEASKLTENPRRSLSFRDIESLAPIDREEPTDGDILVTIQKPAPLPPYAIYQPGTEGYESEFSESAEFVDCRDAPDTSSKGQRFWSQSSTHSAKNGHANFFSETERSLLDPPLSDKPDIPFRRPLDEYDAETEGGSRLSSVSSTIARRMEKFQNPARLAELQDGSSATKPRPRSVLLPMPPAVREEAPNTKPEVAPPPTYKPPSPSLKQGAKTFSGVRPENKKSLFSTKTDSNGPTIPPPLDPVKPAKQAMALAVPVPPQKSIARTADKPKRSHTAPKNINQRGAAVKAPKKPESGSKASKKNSATRKTAAECVAEDRIALRGTKESVTFPSIDDDDSFVDVPSTKSFGKKDKRSKTKTSGKDDNRPLVDKYKKRMDGVNALSEKKKAGGRSKNVSKGSDKRKAGSRKQERSRRDDVPRAKKRPSNKPKVMVLPVRAHSDFNEPKSASAEMAVERQERAQSDIFKVPKNAAHKRALAANAKRAKENIEDFAPSKETSSMVALKTSKQASLARRHSLPTRGSTSDLALKANADEIGAENFSDRSRSRGIKAPAATKQQRTQTMLASLWGQSSREESLGIAKTRRASTDLDPQRAKSLGLGLQHNTASMGNIESMDAGTVPMYHDERTGLFSGVRKLFSKVRRKPTQCANEERMSIVDGDERNSRGSINRGGFRESMQRGSTGIRGSIVGRGSVTSGRGSIVSGRRHKSEHKNRKGGRALFK